MHSTYMSSSLLLLVYSLVLLFRLSMLFARILRKSHPRTLTPPFSPPSKNRLRKKSILFCLPPSPLLFLSPSHKTMSSSPFVVSRYNQPLALIRSTTAFFAMEALHCTQLYLVCSIFFFSVRMSHHHGGLLKLCLSIKGRVSAVTSPHIVPSL